MKLTVSSEECYGIREKVVQIHHTATISALCGVDGDKWLEIASDVIMNSKLIQVR